MTTQQRQTRQQTDEIVLQRLSSIEDKVSNVTISLSEDISRISRVMDQIGDKLTDIRETYYKEHGVLVAMINQTRETLAQQQARINVLEKEISESIDCIRTNDVQKIRQDISNLSARVDKNEVPLKMMTFIASSLVVIILGFLWSLLTNQVQVVIP